jgi:hypothetical protein
MGRRIIINIDKIEAMIKSIFVNDLPINRVFILIVAPTTKAIIIRSPSIGKKISIVNLSL